MKTREPLKGDMGRKQPNIFPLRAGCSQARGELPMHLEFMDMGERGGFSGWDASFPETHTQHRPKPKTSQYVLKRAVALRPFPRLSLPDRPKFPQVRGAPALTVNLL